MPGCQSCGCDNLFDDTVGLEKVTICEGCGAVQDTVVLQDIEDHGQVGYSLSSSTTLEKKYGVATEYKPAKLPKVARAALKSIEAYTMRFPNGPMLFEQTELKFTEMVNRPKYQKARFDSKMAIATACLVQVLRSNKCKVLVNEVCAELQVGVRHINKYLMKLGGKERTSSMDLIEKILSETPDFSCKPSLRQTAFETCKFLDVVNLNSSYSRQGIAICSVYFAYISEEPVAVTPENLTNFCRIYHFPRHTASTVYSKAKTKFMLFAKRLPWVDGPVSEYRYHRYIRPIIKWKHALLSESANDTTVPFKRKVEQDDTEENPSKVLITEQMVLEMAPSQIIKMEKPDPEDVIEPDIGTVSHAETLDENDIHESDLCQYIRTDAEVEIAEKIKEMVEELED